MALLRYFVSFSLFCTLALGTAFAASYEDGLRAYDAGRTKEALSVWQGLAEKGDPQAKYGIGKIYDTGGQGVARNHAEAARWYEEAARAGVVAASNNLALLYAEGLGVPQDRARAVELWKRAAEQGHREAQYNYALSLYRGSGVVRDPAAAAKWFRYAAEQGLPEAQFAVGEMYLIGIGLPKDPSLALGWYRRAEAQGHSAAAAQAGQLAQAGVTPKQPEILPALSTAEKPVGTPQQPLATGAPTPLLPSNSANAAPAATAPTPEVLVSAEGPSASADTQTPPPELAPEPAPEPAIKAREAEPPKAVTPAENAAPAEAPSAARPTAATPSQAQTAAAPDTEATVPEEASNLEAPPGSWTLWLLSAGTEAEAKSQAGEIMQRYSSLADLRFEVQRSEAGGRGYYRALAGGWPDVEEARRLCRALRAEDPDAFCSPMERR